MKIEYTKIGDYELPNLELNNITNGEINRYGRLRLNYLKVNNKPLYTTLLLQNKLTTRLVSVSIEAQNRFNFLMESYKKSDEKLSEKSKELNQLQWIKLMNNYKNRVEEIILKEIIYI